MITGADVFCDWLFLGYSCVSLDTAANFRLFVNVAIFGKKIQQWWRLNCFLLSTIPVYKQIVVCSISWGNSFPLTTVNLIQQKSFNVICRVFYNTIIIISTFASPIYTFSLAGNIYVYAPSQGTKREKYYIQINYKVEKCWLWEEINTFQSIPSFIRCAFSIIRRKMYEPNPTEKNIKVLIHAPTQ